jgi:hypothetical protein
MMRKPSCLISCSQSGPHRGVIAGIGRHGLMIAGGWGLTRNMPLRFPTGRAVVKARGGARALPMK